MLVAKSRRYPVLLLSVLAAVALAAALVGIAAAEPADAITISELVPTNGSTVPTGQAVTVSTFVISDTPITSVVGYLDGTQLDVQLVVGSGALRAGFTTSRTFTAGSHTLRVTAINENRETTELQSTFTAAAGATTTATTSAATTTTAAATTTGVTTSTVPAILTTVSTTTAAPTTTAISGALSTATVAGATATTTAAPAELPQTGGVPIDLALPALLGLGAAAAGIGLRLRLH